MHSDLFGGIQGWGQAPGGACRGVRRERGPSDGPVQLWLLLVARGMVSVTANLGARLVVPVSPPHFLCCTPGAPDPGTGPGCSDVGALVHNPPSPHAAFADDLGSFGGELGLSWGVSLT